jgi:AmmeMemoRadiSam system protein B
MTREPAVAGQFYDATKNNLLETIEGSFLGELGPGRLPTVRQDRLGHVMGLVCPHAGYVYSGSAAAWAYDALAEDGIPEAAVLLGPNHYGMGAMAALSPDESWATPLGTLTSDAGIAGAILERSRYIERDGLAHIKEHSIEVQLPFLQYLAGEAIRIVPISIAHLSKTDALLLVEDLGSAIAEAISGGKSAVIIASTDFTHYESKATATATDAIAIGRILELDPKGLIEEVYSRDITMCGAIGTAVMLEACKRLGATSARKLTYYTSGDVTGDTDQVVGYGAISIER